MAATLTCATSYAEHCFYRKATDPDILIKNGWLHIKKQGFHKDFNRK
jgi:hypothetical protein